MRAVAHVVSNRAGSAGFPDTICDVVKAGSAGGGCQFHWWCDGRPDDATNAELYAVALKVSRQVLAGKSKDPTDGATMFHNTSVTPGWAKKARRTAAIGHHVFYRDN